jgi:hypothetical protein
MIALNIGAKASWTSSNPAIRNIIANAATPWGESAMPTATRHAVTASRADAHAYTFRI